MRLPAILTSILLSCALGCALAAAPPKPSTDEVLLDMHQAYKKGDAKRLSALLPQTRGHLLEPWAAYWELRVRLETASSTEIEAFLQRYQGTYQEDRLRNDWLLLLGQRRDWERFSAQYPLYRMQDDREVRCYALAQMLQAPTAASLEVTAAEIRHLWYAQKEADDACLGAAGQALALKALGEGDIWHKVHLAAEANQLRSARAALELLGNANLAAFDELRANPARYLSKRVIAGSRTAREMVVLALIRLALQDVQMAASVLENHWSVHLREEQRSWAWGVIGRQLTQRLSPDAMEHFAKARDTDLDDEHLAWKVRAALRQGLWKAVLPAINAMSPAAQADPTWTYWRARALLQPGRNAAERAQAHALLQGIGATRGFYEQLALEELGNTVTVPARPTPLSAQEKESARANPGLQRALAAIALGLRAEGVREWNYSTNLHQSGGMSERELLAAADLACEREVWDRCINTSERTRSVMDFTQRFPTPHKEAVLAQTARIGLDPAFVYGLIRQESRFVTDAQSSVGAAGLMQIMPATARWTARRIGLEHYKPQQITQRDTNIAIGTGYLKLVLQDFGGSMALAAAAYNAGPSRSRSWRSSVGSAGLEAAIWAETIPFAETRDYVKKVLANTTNYAAVLSEQNQSLKSRLGLIRLRGATESDADLP